MERVNCNLCGSSRYRKVYSKPDVNYYPDEFFQVVECEDCGLGYVNPRPTIQEISKYYPVDFFECFEKEKDFHAQRYFNESRYLDVVPENYRILLDVGCANGMFPCFMKKLGWKAEGLEVSANAKEMDNVVIHRVPFTDFNPGPVRYGVVTMWAVLEHTHDPKSYLRKANSVLMDGGYLVFLVTNFSSLASRRLFAEDVPRHLYFFTEKTIQEYLSQANFTLVASRYGNDVYPLRPVG